MPIEVFIKSAATSATRVPGTAVFMTTSMTRRAARAAPQYEAQQGAARARHDADGADRGCALCRRGSARRDQGLWRGFFRIILRYGFMEEIDVPAALPGREVRAAVQDDGHQLLPRAPDADRVAGPAWRCGARSCSPGCCATPKARWSSSSCRPTAWSNWAARSKSRKWRSIAGWVAPVATTIAALMTASNLGSRITGYGFIVFTIGSIAWLYAGRFDRPGE